MDSKGYVTTVGEALEYWAQREEEIAKAGLRLLRAPTLIGGRKVGRTAALRRRAEADGSRVIPPG